MKTLIVYGSSYGYAKECAKQLSKQIEGEVVLVNAMEEGISELKAFNNVIIGGSIYMGQIQKKIKNFCNTNIDVLGEKKLGLFLCCGLPENLEQSLKNSFPEKLKEKAAAFECFGGELRRDKMKFVHKMITGVMLKAAEKEGKAPIRSMPENISKLARIMNEHTNPQ